MQPRPLFLRTSGSSGVPKALLLEGNGQLSCNPKKKKKKKNSGHTLPSRLVHEGDASFLIGHPLHVVMSPWWFSVTVDGRTLSSRLVHEWNASFLFGHLCRACLLALLGVAFFFFFFFFVGKLFITSVKHTCSERTTRAIFSLCVDQQQANQTTCKTADKTPARRVSLSSKTSQLHRPYRR